MKLLAIWNSQYAWAALAAMKKTPKLAYALLKFERKYMAELDICNKQRETIIYDVMQIEPPAMVSIGEDTEQFKVFMARFNEFLQSDSELAPSAVTIDELIESLGSDPANRISEDNIALLEPFFTA